MLVPAPPNGILPAMGDLQRSTSPPSWPTSSPRRRAGSLSSWRTGRGCWPRSRGRVVPAASTIKVPILVAVLRLVARGELGLGDSMQLGDDRVGGSGPLAALASVTQLQVGELLELMITLSDNDATNALLDLVGLAEVDRLCAELGMGRTRCAGG